MLSRQNDRMSRGGGQLTSTQSSADAKDPIGIESGSQPKKLTGLGQRPVMGESGPFLREIILLYLQQYLGLGGDQLIGR